MLSSLPPKALEAVLMVWGMPSAFRVIWGLGAREFSSFSIPMGEVA